MSEQQPTSRRAEPVLSELELYSEYRNCDRWAIIVGISRYQYHGWNLKYAERDAAELYELLLTPNGGGFNKECICKLVNEEATTSKITQALRSFLKKPAREDLVLIYVACHGTPDFDRPDNVYLLTHDTNPGDVAGTALPMREIDLALRENLLAQKVIVLADTCHSGAIGGGIGRRNLVDGSTLVNRYLQEVSRAKGGIALLTSAEANEVSFEDRKWGGGHGVFTYYLLQGMRGAGDRDGNGIVTVGELFEYVRDNVKLETNYQQHPSIGTNAYDRNLPVAIVPNANFSMTSVDIAPRIKADVFSPNRVYKTNSISQTLRPRLIRIGLVFLLLLGFWGFYNYSLPWIATFYNKWGWENYREREYNTAQNNYEIALKLNPNYAEAHFNLGRLYEDLEDSERARSEYELAIKGNYDKAYNNLARLYIIDKNNPKYDVAVQLLQKGLQVAKDDGVKYNLKKNLGWARFEQKRYLEAKAALQEAISLGSERAAAYCLLAQVLEAQRETKDAINHQWENCLAYASSGKSAEEDKWIDEARKRLNAEGNK
jgi:tetratricopeptide (TPR) repeat protein